jgi:hypothetical protein
MVPDIPGDGARKLMLSMRRAPLFNCGAFEVIETHVLLIILFAGGLHAAWNALVKGSSDTLFSMTAVVLGHAPFGMLALPFAALPDAASLPCVVAGAALHVGYQLSFLWA